MTICDPGDVALVRFVFTDESDAKRRPVVVLSSTEFNRRRHEVVVAAVTSNTSRLLPGDHLVERWHEAGLLYPSVVTAIIRTVKRDMVERRLGRLAHDDHRAFATGLAVVLGL